MFCGRTARKPDIEFKYNTAKVKEFKVRDSITLLSARTNLMRLFSLVDFAFSRGKKRRLSGAKTRLFNAGWEQKMPSAKV